MTESQREAEPPLLLRRVRPGAGAAPARRLLRVSGLSLVPSPGPRPHGKETGALYALVDPAADQRETPFAAASVRLVDGSTIALEGLAVDPACGCPSLVPRLLVAVADRLRAEGFRLVVATVPDGRPEPAGLLVGVGFRCSPHDGATPSSRVVRLELDL